MRIFEVTDCYPPPLVGGRDLRVQLLSHELARRGHEVDVLTLAGPRDRAPSTMAKYEYTA